MGKAKSLLHPRSFPLHSLPLGILGRLEVSEIEEGTGGSLGVSLRGLCYWLATPDREWSCLGKGGLPGHTATGAESQLPGCLFVCCSWAGRGGRGRRKLGRKEGGREGGGLSDCQLPGHTSKLPQLPSTQPKSENHEEGEPVRWRGNWVEEKRWVQGGTPGERGDNGERASSLWVQLIPQIWREPASSGMPPSSAFPASSATIAPNRLTMSPVRHPPSPEGVATLPAPALHDPHCPRPPHGRFLFTQTAHGRHFPRAWVTMGCGVFWSLLERDSLVRKGMLERKGKDVQNPVLQGEALCAPLHGLQGGGPACTPPRAAGSFLGHLSVPTH